MRVLRPFFIRDFLLDSDERMSFMSIVLMGVLLGGRLGYVLFYSLSYYLDNPLRLFAIWQGGMSYHGGGVGAVLSVIYFAYSYKKSAWGLLDLLSLGSTIGLFFGRFANFINGELYGRVTTISWGMIFLILMVRLGILLNYMRPF